MSVRHVLRGKDETPLLKIMSVNSDISAYSTCVRCTKEGLFTASQRGSTDDLVDNVPFH